MKRLIEMMDDGVLRSLATIIAFCLFLGAFDKSWNDGLNQTTYARVLLVWLVVIGYLALASRLGQANFVSSPEEHGDNTDA